MVVGSIEVVALTDAVGQLGELAELYPEVPADAWEPYRALYPELFEGTAWRLPCRCFLVRSDGQTVLVDAAIGPPGLWDWTAESEGGLLSGLAELGVQPREIDAVFLTHVHVDHVGWNADGSGVPVFTNARYLLHPAGLAWARTARADAPYVRRCLESIVEAGLVDEVDAGEEIAPGAVAIGLPGHLPGHLGLRIRSDRAEAMLIADAAVHPALLEQPDWHYTFDADPEACTATRRSLLADLVDQDVLVACGHYPGDGIGRIARMDGRVVWVAGA